MIETAAPKPGKVVKLLPPGVAKCGRCGSTVKYSPNLSMDSIIVCPNEKCASSICTLAMCWKTYKRSHNVVHHQQEVHRKNADLNKCYLCKAVKVRNGKSEMGQCAVCGMYWCLFRDCTFESRKVSSLAVHQTCLSHKYNL